MLAGCEKNVEPNLTAYQQKLVVNAEIQPDKPIYLFVSTSVGIGSESMPYNPKESSEFFAEVIVDGNYNEVENISYFEKEEEDGGDMTWRTRRAFRTEVGQNLELNASLLINEEIIPVQAKTSIPEAATVSNVQLISQKTQSGKYAYRLRLDIDNKQELFNGYYHLLIKNDNKYLNINNFQSGANAVEKPYHHYGVLVNESRMLDRTLNFQLESDTELKSIDVELRTCTSAYFDYHVSLSRSFASQNSPYNEPTLNYTNIDNGLGVFAAYSTDYQTFEFE